MSQASFIVLLLVMWAVVAAIYTTIFSVTAGPEHKSKESAPVHPPVQPTKTEHKLPHAA